jgi:hypothetical protein
MGKIIASIYRSIFLIEFCLSFLVVANQLAILGSIVEEYLEVDLLTCSLVPG